MRSRAACSITEALSGLQGTNLISSVLFYVFNDLVLWFV